MKKCQVVKGSFARRCRAESAFFWQQQLFNLEKYLDKPNEKEKTHEPGRNNRN